MAFFATAIFIIVPFTNWDAIIYPSTMKICHDFDGLVQEKRNSSAIAMELCLSCINPSIYNRNALLWIVTTLGFQVMSFNISECPTFWLFEWYDRNHICYLQWNRKESLWLHIVIPRFHNGTKIKISTTLCWLGMILTFRISHAINFIIHDDVIKWNPFPRHWPFVRGIHRSPVNSPHKGQWRGALVFSLICARINSWVNNREAGDFRRHRSHYDVSVIVTNFASHFMCPSWDVVSTYKCLSSTQVYPIAVTFFHCRYSFGFSFFILKLYIICPVYIVPRLCTYPSLILVVQSTWNKDYSTLSSDIIFP